MKKFLFAAALIAAVGVVPAVAEDAAPDDAIKYRQWTMSTVGNHMQSFVAILQQKVPHSEAMAYHANALADAASHAAPAFEQNTAGLGEEKTTAKPEIWDEDSDFFEKLAEFEEVTLALAEAAESGDMGAVGASLQKVGASCKGCHDDYRSK
ncbi:MAG: cytochrome c [Alphaproteobacteria bacterium]|nr:cytochrome c [Alphaproteobacteria bacterium]